MVGRRAHQDKECPWGRKLFKCYGAWPCRPVEPHLSPGPHSPPPPAIPGSHLSVFLTPSHICSNSDCETLAHLSAPISHLSASHLHSTGTQAVLLWPHPWHPKACLLWACLHTLSVSCGASFHRLSDDLVIYLYSTAQGLVSQRALPCLALPDFLWAACLPTMALIVI